jgi:hypothetical protein
MKSVVLGLAIASVAIGMASCESPGRYSAAGRPVSYDAYYDDAYGPFYDGYWGDDGAFYYSGAAGRPFVRDGGGHFLHGAAGGFHGVHGGRGRR